jgi:hypothetical protein
MPGQFCEAASLILQAMQETEVTWTCNPEGAMPPGCIKLGSSDLRQ